ncbi:MAG: hypothetical protein GXP08_08670 [Gammaproteobacteria bacterium]|nr:hypothetical protein [Gammaproteobacteria bacterium]
MFYRNICCFVVLFVSSPLVIAQTNLFEKTYFGLGVSYGGENIDPNPGGNKYRIGSGAILETGASWRLFDSATLSNRTSIAYRYQRSKASKGANTGVVVESALVHSGFFINFGAGIHADILNEVIDAGGNKTEFKNSLGGLFFAEWGLYDNMGVILKYILTDYETQSGITYSGEQYGIYLSIWN